MNKNVKAFKMKGTTALSYNASLHHNAKLPMYHNIEILTISDSTLHTIQKI